jgi:hypothetical protein
LFPGNKKCGLLIFSYRKLKNPKIREGQRQDGGKHHRPPKLESYWGHEAVAKGVPEASAPMNAAGSNTRFVSKNHTGIQVYPLIILVFGGFTFGTSHAATAPQH